MVRTSIACIALLALLAAGCGTRDGDLQGEPLFPGAAVVSPGELQRFFPPVGGVEGWSATCGDIVEDAGMTMVWRAPQTPGRCKIVGEAGRAKSVANVEVRTPVPTVTRLEGMAEPPALPDVVGMGADGALYLADGASIVEFAPGARHWEIDLSVPPISARTLSIGAGGDLLAAGTWDGRAAVLRRTPDGLWTRELPEAGLPAVSSERTWSSAVAPDGSACVLVPDGDPRMACVAGRSGPWVPMTDDVAAGAFTFDRRGRLIVGDRLGDVFAVEAGDSVPMGASGLPLVLGVEDLRGGLFAFGRGISRWSTADETWLQIGDPAPEEWVAALALLGDQLFALAGENGLFRLVDQGRFARVGDRAPIGWFERPDGRIFSREGGIQMPTAHGIWRLEEGDGSWELVSRGGYGFVRRPHGIAFLPDGTAAFGGAGDSCEGSGIYRRVPGTDEWRALEGEVLPDVDFVRNLAIRDDGALAFAGGWHAGSYADGLYLAEAGADSYEPLSRDGLPRRSEAVEPNMVGLRWTGDGSLLAAFEAHGLFRLAAGSTEWEPILHPQPDLLDVLVAGDRIIVVADGDVRVLVEGSWIPLAAPPFHGSWRAAQLRRLALDSESAIWVATSAGVFRLDAGDTAWRPVGTGSCSAHADGVFLGGGRIYCSAGDSRFAELVGDRWMPIPGLGPDARPARGLGVDPDGHLYLDYGYRGSGGLVRTIPAAGR